MDVEAAFKSNSTVRVTEYTVATCSANDGSRTLDGSREVDTTDANPLDTSLLLLMVQVNWRPRVCVEPSHFDTKAEDARDRLLPRVIVSSWGPRIETDGTTRLITTSDAEF